MEKQVRFNLHSVPEIRDEEKRIVTFIISDATRDRHGTILDLKGWSLENFKLNGIVGYQHDVYGGMCGTDPDSVIGKGRAFIEGKGDERKLMGEVEFEPANINELAEKIFQKVKFGTLKATSVGFLPLEKGEFKTEKKEDGTDGEETYHYGKRELLEFSIVNIPSNPKAVKRTFELEKENLPENKNTSEGEQEPNEKKSELQKIETKDVVEFLKGKGCNLLEKDIKEMVKICREYVEGKTEPQKYTIEEITKAMESDEKDLIKVLKSPEADEKDVSDKEEKTEGKEEKTDGKEKKFKKSLQFTEIELSLHEHSM